MEENKKRSYRDVIIVQLRERNRKQSDAYTSLISLSEYTPPPSFS
jgi:hypothetical protein